MAICSGISLKRFSDVVAIWKPSLRPSYRSFLLLSDWCTTQKTRWLSSIISQHSNCPFSISEAATSAPGSKLHAVTTRVFLLAKKPTPAEPKQLSKVDTIQRINLPRNSGYHFETRSCVSLGKNYSAVSFTCQKRSVTCNCWMCIPRFTLSFAAYSGFFPALQVVVSKRKWAWAAKIYVLRTSFQFWKFVTQLVNFQRVCINFCVTVWSGLKLAFAQRRECYVQIVGSIFSSREGNFLIWPAYVVSTKPFVLVDCRSMKKSSHVCRHLHQPACICIMTSSVNSINFKISCYKMLGYCKLFCSAGGNLFSTKLPFAKWTLKKSSLRAFNIFWAQIADLNLKFIVWCHIGAVYFVRVSCAWIY